MAEALLNHYITSLGMRATVISRGLSAPVGRVPHPYAISVAEENGIRLDPQKRAAALTSAEVAIASILLVMDSSHRREIQRRFPTASGKTFLLGQWQGVEIADPVNEPRSAFDVAWHQCDVGVREWIKRIEDAGMLQRNILAPCQ